MYFWGSREFPALVQSHMTHCAPAQPAHSADRPPHTLSRTGGRLADDRSFGLWGGGAQAGGRGLHGNRGVSTVARRLSLCTLGASTLATGAARQLPAVTAAGPSSGLCGLAVTNPIMT